MTDNSNTAKNAVKAKPRGDPFRSGIDKRRNLKGRPKSFDALRKLAIKIAVGDVDPDDPESLTRVEKILRDWASSRERESQERFIETAYGKVPQPVDVTSGGQVINLLVQEVKKPDDG